MSDQYKISVQDELRILLNDIKKGLFRPSMVNLKPHKPKFKAGDRLINCGRNEFDHLYPDTFIISNISEDGDKYFNINNGIETWFYSYQVDEVYVKIFKYNEIWTQLNA
jgi:hypothetical protein